MSRIKLANAIINRLRPKASDIFGGAVAGGAVTAGARYINDLRAAAAAAREAHLENLAYKAKEALPPQYYGAMSALPEQELFTPSVLPQSKNLFNESFQEVANQPIRSYGGLSNAFHPLDESLMSNEIMSVLPDDMLRSFP
jgi:hypothetical protein